MPSVDGLMSGLNTSTIVQQLIDLEARPVRLLEARVETANAQKQSYAAISSALLDLSLKAMQIGSRSAFERVSVNSSNTSILSATGSANALQGTFNFLVARTASVQQVISSGVASRSAAVGAGTMQLEIGGGYLDRSTLLDALNGGDGISRGTFTIQDKSGASAAVNVTSAVTVQDVIDSINNTSGIRVEARVAADGRSLEIVDQSGGAGNLSVHDSAGKSTALSLGIAKTVAGATLTGDAVNYLSENSQLDRLNDGQGLRLASGLDLRVTVNGTSTDLNLSNRKTVGDVLDLLKSVTGVTDAYVSADGSRLVVEGNNLEFSSLGGSKAAEDLGLVTSAPQMTVTGDKIFAGMNSVLLKNVSGTNKTGVALGTIQITDRAGNTAQIDLSAARDMNDVLHAINGAAGVNVVAELNGSANGIGIRDVSGGIGAITIADVDSTTAADLGILAAGVNAKKIDGADIDFKWMSENTRLADLNTGAGVPTGRFQITNKAGETAFISITDSDKTIGDVLKKINTGIVGVTASINATGDGVLLTDTSGGAGTLRVEEIGSGRTAFALNIAGSNSTGNTINGSFEFDIEISATDSIDDVALKINSLNRNVTASVINDGSGATPFRLSLVSSKTGAQSRFVMQGGTTSFGFSEVSRASDATVIVGAGSSSAPFVVTSATNTMTTLLEGITINLNSASSEIVTLKSERDVSQIAGTVKDFVDKFNEIVAAIDEQTKFDPETFERGILNGESAVANVRQRLFGIITNPLQGLTAGYNRLSSIGISVTDQGRLEFDSAKFGAALNDNLPAVKELLTGRLGRAEATTLVGDLRDGAGIRRAEGKNDLKITLRDGSEIEVNLDGIVLLNKVIDELNAAGGGKLLAQLASDGQRIEIFDQTAGIESFSIVNINGSLAATDLGIANSTEGSKITGSNLRLKSAVKGAGTMIKELLDGMVDSVDGMLTRRGKALDSQIEGLNSSITNWNKRLDSKRERLFAEFAALESALAEIQAQQSALSMLSASSIPVSKGAIGSGRK